MKRMANGATRQSQLVTPFGVGAMQTLVDGSSVITGGLDYWFEGENARNIQLPEFVRHDWRLEERLGVEQFRVPPDYRSSFGSDGIGHEGDSPKNLGLTVPVLRFPRYHLCPYCKRLKKTSLHESYRPYCDNPSHSSKARMVQVPFVTYCENGHLDDFPFKEWVHRDANSRCSGQLLLQSRGNGLGNQIVKCVDAEGREGCGRERSLSGVTRLDPESESSTLSRTLQPEDDFLCTGHMPWLGDFNEPRGCGLPLVATLRGAGNVYFPRMESSIFVPSRNVNAESEIVEILESPQVSPLLKVAESFHEGLIPAASKLVHHLGKVLSETQINAFHEDKWFNTYQSIRGGLTDFGKAQENLDRSENELGELESEQKWRDAEYAHLRTAMDDPFLRVSVQRVPHELTSFISGLNAVETLKETRVLTGFNRGRTRPLSLSAGKRLLSRRALSPSWLPAYVVKGEGIFIQLDSDRLAKWEKSPSVKKRVAAMQRNLDVADQQRGVNSGELLPRFVLAHTLAHILMNQLIFQSGYSSASLRERLYFDYDREKPNVAILIYTAAGDSEGTMGGLVKMGAEKAFGATLQQALEEARWCSADPVCMEVGAAGQGPDSCNLAACHSCCLVPETSCEHFNRFLDRGLLIGSFSEPELGYFN